MARAPSRASRVVVAGPLGPFAEAYRSRLEERGYTALTMVNELRQVARLSRWMESAELGVAELTTEQLDRFYEACRGVRDSRNCSLRTLVVLLEMLADDGVLAKKPPAVPVSEREVVLSSFQHYLLAERGLADCTAEAYVARARRFLAGLEVDGGDLGGATSADVTAAVRAEAQRVSVGSAQYFVAGLRSFLRFCFIEGLVSRDLSAAALAVTGRRRSSLPKGISGNEADALLRSCDRRRGEGRRDYAILVILLRLGLRAGEVAALNLDDIDWRAGEMVVNGKGSRSDRLPLPADVGEAIVAYLQRGRPKTSRREVFLRTVAPIGPLGRGGVSFAVRRACRRAGLAEIGSHRLRHTLACDMVAHGVALPAIGQVLRHRAVSSTAIYARVDVAALRQLALPWPGGDGR